MGIVFSAVNRNKAMDRPAEAKYSEKSFSASPAMKGIPFLMMQTVFSTLLQVMVPLSMPVIAGALLRKYGHLDTKPLVTLHLYFLSPALVLEMLTTAELTLEDIGQTVAFCLVNLAVMWGAAVLTARWLKLAAPETAGITLISTMTNSVNYGLPLILLAFGKPGLDKAAVYVIIQMILANTVAVYFAARSQFTVRGAIKSVFMLPSVYAAALAILLRAFHWSLPGGIAEGISMAAAAYSPVVLAILGAQMISVTGTAMTGSLRKSFWAGLAVRMVLAPVLTLMILYALNIRGLMFSVFFILSSMPVAVNAVVLAEKFNASPRMLAKCILWTTLASFAVLPVLIVLVGG
jgi:hypothetical protein